MGGFLGRNGRFGEFENTGAGACANERRPQLSAAEAETLTDEKVLGWQP